MQPTNLPKYRDRFFVIWLFILSWYPNPKRQFIVEIQHPVQLVIGLGDCTDDKVGGDSGRDVVWCRCSKLLVKSDGNPRSMRLHIRLLKEMNADINWDTTFFYPFRQCAAGGIGDCLMLCR